MIFQWQKTVGRDRDGDQINSRHLIDTETGRIWGLIDCPRNDEVGFECRLPCGHTLATFVEVESAQTYLEGHARQAFLDERFTDSMREKRRRSFKERFRRLFVER